MSTSLKQSLQKELFLNEERLLICIPTGKSRGAAGGLGKKARQPSFLCITVTSEKPVQIRIHVVKKSERSGEAYKRKQSWLLSDLKCVDGKDYAKDSADFELVFEKPYKWVAENIEDREAFIKLLWKLSWKHLELRAKFLNMQHVVDEMDLESSTSAQRGHAPAGDALLGAAGVGESGDYQVLTAKEEADLSILMTDCDFAISQANAFAEQLTKDLSTLEGANIHSMMASEDSISQLMKLLDDGIKQSTRIEDRLVSYEHIIKSVKTQMEIMRDKDSMIRIQEANHEKLKMELGELVDKLDLGHDCQTALLGGDLATSRGVADCTAAAAALAACMKASIPKALASMSGVKEQQKLFDKLRVSFSRRLSHHLNNLFIHMGNATANDILSRAIMDFRLRSLQKHHRELVPYADLMAWLGTADPVSFEQLKQVYLESFQKVYQKEIGEYIENAQLRIPIKGDKRAGAAGPADLSGSSSSLQTGWHSESSLSDDRARHVQFGQVCSRVLNELAPLCTEEQKFCMRFFPLAKDKTDDSQAEEKMLISLFSRLDQDLQSFMNYSHKQDPYYSLCLLVQLSQQASRIDPACFLVKILGNCLVTVKRNFDAFIKTLVQSFKETKVNKKSRCGIIGFVHDFEVFAEQAEVIFQGSDRRSDLDRAYKLLVETVFEEVNRVALDHLKTPRSVVLMENYHHLFGVFSRLKIASLDSERKEAKQKKQDYMQAYVAEQLGQPMEKLNVFFEGVEAQINSGVKPEEVGYQLAFSKQELRRVIKEYPAREVKRSLDALYRKVEKHLCEEENLLQVVWRSMQEDFLKQYKHFEMMIAKCYGDSQITPEFTIDEVLQYFSEIAQSH